MHPAWIALACAGALAGGASRLIGARLRVARRREFALEFLGRFQRWANGRGQDNESYAWLVHRSGRLQSQMGADGIIHHFRPPFAGYAYPRYPLVINFLPEMRRLVGELDGFSGRQFLEYASSMQEAIVRHVGALEDRAERIASDLRNPFAWIRAAVQFVLLLPLTILEWAGLDRYPAVARVTGSWPAKLLSALLVIFASVVTILSGWDQAIAVLARLASRARH